MTKRERKTRAKQRSANESESDSVAIRHHVAMLETLVRWFPWLGTDEPANGSDTVDRLIRWHATQGEIIADLRRHHIERGSIRLTLLAFQLAMAVGIGSGVLSILEWAQAALGGVL